MEFLRNRWSGCQAIPRTTFALLPTPVRQLPTVSARLGIDVWVKRDDRTSATYGGNKVRKLEWLLGLAEARRCDTLITTGAFGSHHVLATACFGRERGFAVEAVMVPQPWSAEVEDNVRLLVGLDVDIVPVNSYAAVVPRLFWQVVRARFQGRKPFLIGPGGSSPVGAIGYVEAGLELAHQIEEGALPEPDAVIVALGSGGTVAGLAVGLAAAGLMTRVIAVRVVDAHLANRQTLHNLVSRTVRYLRKRDRRFPDVSSLALRNIEIDPSQLGPGYGAASDAARHAMAIAKEDEHLDLDTTYTAKTFASVLETAERHREYRRVLYWHTLSDVDLTERLERSPALPLSLRERVRSSIALSDVSR